MFRRQHRLEHIGYSAQCRQTGTALPAGRTFPGLPDLRTLRKTESVQGTDSANAPGEGEIRRSRRLGVLLAGIRITFQSPFDGQSPEKHNGCLILSVALGAVRAQSCSRSRLGASSSPRRENQYLERREKFISTLLEFGSRQRFFRNPDCAQVLVSLVAACSNTLSTLPPANPYTPQGITARTQKCMNSGDFS